MANQKLEKYCMNKATFLLHFSSHQSDERKSFVKHQLLSSGQMWITSFKIPKVRSLLSVGADEGFSNSIFEFVKL